MKALSEFMREVSEECGLEHYVSTRDIAPVVIAATRDTISEWTRYKETMPGADREAVRDSWEENYMSRSQARYWSSVAEEQRVWRELLMRNGYRAYLNRQDNTEHIEEDTASMWIDAVISILVVEGDDVEA